MDPRRRDNSYLVFACTLALGFLICMPVTTHSLIRGDCFLPPDEGNCGNRLTLRVKYYFDSTNDDCSEFLYFGCGGNDNRFDTFEECENVCLFNNGF
ncbi:kappaPI-actitoxin-Avd3d-like [Rhopalosiphum maidis]|uniref:kappaPI-actitoxin-Avd3d-like n=1 Tax=Rhopalosiphum maidis TaxID=43146 RepID=UPI000F001FC7|nr:kappaPI-actitoxin-Avd3d-like [Rhopalosiphum maidis]